MSTLFSFRLADDLKVKLASLAEATHRSKSFLAAEALERYLQTESWQVAHIHKGIRQADEGNVFAGEDVDKWLASWGKSAELPAPKPLSRSKPKKRTRG